MLFNRDKNLLCRIEKMRKAQVAIKEDGLSRFQQAKKAGENCLASKRKIAHLREMFKESKEEI